MKKVLVIAPHPDDEVLGCGGTIASHVEAGDQVYLCIVTKAYTPEWTEDFLVRRQQEVKQSNAILGITETMFLDFPTVKLDTIPQKELNGAIAAVFKKVCPEIVYIPHQGDMHQDHRLVFFSSLVAARPHENATVKRLLSYETLSETDWGAMIFPFVPTTYVDISKTLDKKIKAMEAYQSEIRAYPHQRSVEMITVLAKKRGSEAHVPAAEAFRLIREIQ